MGNFSVKNSDVAFRANRVRKYALAGAAALCFAAGAASAQDVAQAEGGVEAVSVTGTRIVRDGYSAPTPVTVVGAEQIQATAPANLADFVNSSLPSVIGSETNNNSSGSLSNGLAGINALNLRSLGVNRTLILLDGHRTPASAATGDIDINTIPQQLVKRVDVVTGGASADYGSDAVGGVVNFILDKEFSGFKADVEYGETDAGLQPSYKANATYGMDFDGGKGHFLLSGEWVQTRPTPKDYNPAWNKSGFFKVQNPAYNAVTNSSVPFYLIQSGIGAGQVAPGGLVINSVTVPAPGKAAGVSSTAFAGTYFGQNAVVDNLSLGTLTGPWMIGGETNVTQANYGGTNSLAAGETRESIYSRGSYYVTPDIEVWAEGSISRFKGFGIYQQPPAVGGITIKNDNAFLPASVKAAMVAQGIASLNMGSTNSGFPESGSLNGREVWRAAAGADGTFNFLSTDWKWDYYAQYGMANTREQETPVWNNARLALAQDAVFVTAGNVGASGLPIGSIACRSTLTAPANGCVPLSRVGVNGGLQSPAAFQQGLNYVLGTPYRTQRLQEQSTGFNVSGSPIENWAGPISVAFGAEWRLESINGFVEPQYNSGWLFGNYLVNKGHYSVAETYLETVVPLMKGLDFNGAYRYTAYSTSGGVSTWKTGLTYSPLDDIKFRVTYSHDIRAPNLNELFAAGTARTNTVAVNNQSLTFVQNQTGNPNLSPEAANSLGLGTVITPTMIPGLALSVDYYNITIAHAIGSITAQNTADLCFVQSIQQYCNNIAYVGGTTATPVYGALSSDPMTVTNGEFYLFIRDPELPDTRLMRYRMNLTTEDGKVYSLDGRKLVHDDVGFDIWADVTTLFITLYEGADGTGSVIGKGILQIQPKDMQQQARTMTVTNARTPEERLATLARFGDFFMGELYDVYGGITRQQAYFNPDAPPRKKRPLRVGAPQVHYFNTEDGLRLRLTRYQGGAKGPVMLVHGLGVSSRAFSTDLIETNLTEYLYAHGYDVWLLDFRSSIELPYATTQYTADDIAIYDYPAAVQTIRELTGAPDILVVAHCYGAIAFNMAMLSGLEGVRAAVCSQVGSHLSTSRISRVKSGIHLDGVLADLGVKSLSLYTDTHADWINRMFDRGLELYPTQQEERCDSPVCHRVTFLYAPIFEHDQLNAATHDNLHELFGVASISNFEHLGKMTRAGKIVNHEGEDVYLPHVERMAIPIAFIHGAENELWLPDSTRHTYEWLCEANGKELYSRTLIPSYGHIDCIFGKNAAQDVYPIILKHLEANL